MNYLCFFVFVVATALEKSEDSNPDIQVTCEEQSIHVKWKLDKSMTGNPARLFLGSCFPSQFLNASNGEAEAHFHYPLSRCEFRRTATWKYLVYENTLSYRPLPKPNPPSFTYPVTCVNDRPKGWTPAFQSLSTGVIQGHGELAFQMAILNHDFSGPAESSVFPLGSFVPIWAGVDQQGHQPLVLLLEECVASTTLEIYPDTLMYPIISNKGCLVDGQKSFSKFLPRSHSSSLLLHLQAFRFAVGQEVYIHCKLIAWDPDNLNDVKKACNYNKATGEWELLDDPFQSSLCQCCDSTCGVREKRDTDSAPQGLVLKSVLGPLRITEDSA
ncbi:zona pellucida glycoprotein 3f, tandem duplicate 2 isoform X1 [Megalobrama amblycephala]|uniref:zona pellucida glycoprotein 3f, tandem duplicate 2 isoform X1 n=2 Tax=Megalobrama amblycephala TaxID=75352 RepID=UPI002013FFF8|nr:zona pellucida glycoprotein 3f, tandem duplicate 2 isoform X1 [Megalobrama amblycephala]XP_048018867.1 zona pellucida glycoprotein 3f, tandem duplicate 2 isoform X1 [Megalobrama amblycephala]